MLHVVCSLCNEFDICHCMLFLMCVCFDVGFVLAWLAFVGLVFVDVACCCCLNSSITSLYS